MPNHRKSQPVARALRHSALLLSLLAGAQANAGLMLETYASGQATPEILGGYQMTDFDINYGHCDYPNISNPVDCQTSSVLLPGGLTGEVQFLDRYDSALLMEGSVEGVEGSGVGPGWWTNGETHNYDIFTTNVNWVELVLPENTRAFSFNVGASFSGWGWMVGFNDGASKHEFYASFEVGYGNTPGFGVYADNSKGECGSISSIIIDPSDWGVGNFSINVGECAASVPEPGVLGLLAVGLLGLGVARSRFTG